MILTHSGITQVLQFELATFFFIGRIGGVHCLGMCGLPMTMYVSYPGQTEASASAVLTTYDVRQHTLFNLGRTVRYAVRGSLFDLVGTLFFDAAPGITVGESVRAIVGTVGKRVPHDALPIYQLFNS